MVLTGLSFAGTSINKCDINKTATNYSYNSLFRAEHFFSHNDIPGRFRLFKVRRSANYVSKYHQSASWEPLNQTVSSRDRVRIRFQSRGNMNQLLTWQWSTRWCNTPGVFRPLFGFRPSPKRPRFAGCWESSEGRPVLGSASWIPLSCSRQAAKEDCSNRSFYRETKKN